MDNFLSASALLVAYAQQQLPTVPEKKHPRGGEY